ncbi:restriction endonuclease subunit S [Pontibacter sp. BAB1700]|uniref:restriction endonuclease subunit S n=1 Tax=Pontibacter sp. BAB1700 TaxID=1144253 RepID=UPI00026BC982|nr:restriction endonuclease subunit S [Pontibacter sp. BAB1700]EJF10590.1 restriction modification system DNA specificity domain [Pontibacter sp. BAB1700]
MKTNSTLGEVANFLSGNAWSASKFKSEGEIPIIRIQNLGENNASSFVYWDNNYDSKYVIYKGDMLLSLSGSIKVDIWKGPNALLNQRIVKIKAKEEVNERWLFWQLSKVLSEIEKMGKLALVNNVSINDLKAFKVYVPPLEEQKRIAQVLDKADRLRQKDRQLLQHYDQLLQSVFLDMFGDPVRNEKGWERGTIRDIITEAKYGTSKPAELEGEYPYLRMNNLTYSGSMDFTDLKYINLEAKERDKYLVKKGDLLFNRTNSKELVGKTAVYRSDTEMAIAGYLIRVRTNERANTDYISGYLNSLHGKDTLRGMSKSIVGMANINAQELQDIKILIPPKALQDKYAGIVEKVEEMKHTAIRGIDKSETLFQSLLQKAFKGELTLREVAAVGEQVPAKPKFVISSIL